MSTEQLKVFYDLDKLLPIINKEVQISSDTTLSDECKLDVYTEYIEGLDPDLRREYTHYKNLIINQNEHIANTYLCQKEYEGKSALLEIVNLQHSYSRRCAMIGMIAYLQQRLEGYKSDDKQVIEKFLTELFGGHSPKYMGTVYDLYYKNNKAKYPEYIPTIPPDVLGDKMPSIEQVKNYEDYVDTNLETIRGVVSAVFGFKPGQEATIHVHGVFNDANDKKLLDYRNKNANKFNGATELLLVPFGHTSLIDRFRCLRENVVLFNPSDPDVEILHQNRVMTDMNNHTAFKKRLNKLEGRMSKDDLASIKQYRTEIDNLRNAPAQMPKVNQKLAKLKSKIDRIYEANTKDNEVITEVIKIGDGKVTKTAYATEATD